MGVRGLVAIGCTAVLLVPAAIAQTSASAEVIADETVPKYGVFEATFVWPSADYSNPWEQTSLSVTLTSPSGGRTEVEGFYFGRLIWKARFSPAQAGRWKWVARLTDSRHGQTFRGAFVVLGKSGHGFVRRSPFNRFRWLFADGTPYYPLGIGDCVRDENESGSPLDDFHLDGDFSMETEQRSRVQVGTYLRAYQRAGVNLFRWSLDNCAFGLYRTIAPEGNTYLEREGRWGDQFVRELRAHGFRIYMVIFGFDPPFASNPTPAQIAAVHRYIDYVVARYGAYVDFWELMNESRATTTWYDEIARYLRQVDTYRHPISTSWERPDLPMIEINAPHWYERESEFDSDARTWQEFLQWRGAGKPVIVGEQGNQGHNWDDRSALRMRLRSWTAFFASGTLIFWNTSSRKNYEAASANIYLGPEERAYLSVLQTFTRGFDTSAQIVPVHVSSPKDVRAYGLSGPRNFAAYLHAFRNHSSPMSGIRVALQSRTSGIATWIAPATGRTLGHTRVRLGSQVLTAPPFVVDLALKIQVGRPRDG